MKHCHIVRRTGGKPEGVCFASLVRIAGTCKISERKAQQVLKFLIEARMIIKEKNSGRKTDEYRVTPPRDWIPSQQLSEVRSRLIKRTNKKSTRVTED